MTLRFTFGAFLGALLVSLAGCAASVAGTDPTALTTTPTPLAPGALIGSTPQILNAEFGQPALRRVDGAAQVWLYQANSCGLNLILYPDPAGTPRVAMAAPTADGADASICTVALQRAHVTLVSRQSSAAAELAIN